MPFANLIPYVERHLAATSTTVLYAWLTGWQSADGVDSIRAVIKTKNAVEAFQWQLAIQYAEVRADAPSAPVLPLNTWNDANQDTQTGEVSVSGSTATNRLFRIGIAYRSSYATVSQGDVGLIASWKSFATPMGAKRVTLAVADLGTKYEALTEWFPATLMAKIKAAFVMNSITGNLSNFRYRLAYQTAGAIIQQPNAWVEAEQTWTTPSVSYNERNTHELTVSTADMWIRLGVAYGHTSGVDSNTTAILEANCAIRS